MNSGSRSLRIAMISYYLPSASKMGIGYQVHELATELVRRGHSVDVFSECPPVEGAIYGHFHVRISGPLRTFRFATKLRKLDFSSYDVLHAHGDDYWLWRHRGPRHVRTINGSCFEEARRIRGAKEKLRMFLLGCSEVLASLVADRSVAISPETLKWYPWVSDVIPCGVDLTRFGSKPEARTAHPVILFVGTWAGRKRGQELVRQFAEVVRPAVPDAELWMVSRDVPAAVPEGVNVLGALSNSELADVYRRAWVFCLPSDYEGFGIPYVEAMAAGLPVVATPNVGARYITDEGRFGLLRKLPEIGTALAYILTDADARRELSRLGKERVAMFDLRHVIDQYLDEYRAAPSVDAVANRQIGNTAGVG